MCPFWLRFTVERLGMTVNNIKIEIALPCDAIKMAKIEQNCFSTPWSREMIERDITGAQSRFWCAKEEDVVGHIGITFAADTADITTVAVLPDFRRRGIAAMLLDTALDFCKSNGIRELFLEVRQSNTAAISLYEKNGFEKISVRKNYYKQPCEDAVIYRKETDK